MSLQSIEWLDEAEVYTLIDDLREKYCDDPINIISYNPIGYVCRLDAIANFYDDDILKLAAVVCRSIIQGHPLQDGNKRFGMYLATYFLGLNNILVSADNENYVDIALRTAKSEADIEAVYLWFCQNTIERTENEGNAKGKDKAYRRF